MKQLSGLLLDLYRTARETPLAKFQDAALALLKRKLPFDSSMWGAATLDPAIGLHTIHLHNEPPEMLVEYQAVKNQDMVADALLKQRGGLLNVHSESLFAGEQYAEMRGFLKKFGHQNALITSRFDPASQQMQFVSLYRADPDRQFSTEEGQLAELLIPHLLEALTINRVTHLERISGWNNQPVHSLAISDQNGSLHHADEEFLGMLQFEMPDWRPPQLPAVLLQDLGVASRYVGKNVIITGKRDAELLFLRARPRTLIDALTDREAQVVKQFAQGSTYREIATELGIAPSTARSHIQAIYNKLHINNKAELIKLMEGHS